MKYAIVRMCNNVIAHKREELELLGADIKKLYLRTPFPRITYSEVIQFLQARGVGKKWGEDIKRVDEIMIGNHYEQPVFITHYPSAIKFFNLKEDPNSPEVVLSSDLIFPEHGEVNSTAEREDSYEKLSQKIEKIEHKMINWGGATSDYAWYLDLRKNRHVAHGGFGIGFDRLVKWICDFDSILYATEFPRNRVHFLP